MTSILSSALALAACGGGGGSYIPSASSPRPFAWDPGRESVRRPRRIKYPNSNPRTAKKRKLSGQSRSHKAKIRRKAKVK